MLLALCTTACSRAIDEPAPPPLPPLPSAVEAPRDELGAGRLSRSGLRFPAHATVLRESACATEIDVPAGLARVERFLLPQLDAVAIEREPGKTIFVGAIAKAEPSAPALTVVLRADGAHTRVALRRDATPSEAEVASLPPARPDPKPLAPEPRRDPAPVLPRDADPRGPSPVSAKVE